MTRRNSSSVSRRPLVMIDSRSAPLTNARRTRGSSEGRDLAGPRSDPRSSLTGPSSLLALWLADVSADAIERSILGEAPVTGERSGQVR